MSTKSKGQGSSPNGYSVGYGKPPSHSKFKPGQSGNPKGRPKGLENFTTIVKRALEEKVQVTEKGRVRSISKLQLAVTQQVNLAAKGDPRAFQFVLSLNALLEGAGNDPSGSVDRNSQSVVAEALRRLRNE